MIPLDEIRRARERLGDTVLHTPLVRFDETGRHMVRKRRACGSEIDVVVRMTKDEQTNASAAWIRRAKPGTSLKRLWRRCANHC